MTPQAERIKSLDVLRGLGILGILAVNAPFFSQPLAVMFEPEAMGPMTAESQTVWWATHTFFERKFITLFSMLFGISILLVGGEKGDPQRQPNLFRRMGWLALFGLIHGALVWYGDILLTYAVAGFIAAQFRSMKPGRLLWIGAAIYLAFAAFEALSYWAMAYMPPEMMDGAMPFTSPESAQREIAGFTGTFMESLTQNFVNWAALVSYSIGYLPSTVGLMFVGMALYKTGVFSARSGWWLYLLLALTGAAALAAIGWATCQQLLTDFKDAKADAIRMTLNALLTPLVTLGYVGVICLILKTPLRLLTAPLAATGQMAFTNYLTQSIIMTCIFYGGRGLGLFGSMDAAETAVVVAGVWIAQLVWSPIWMAFFTYGPFEWVWRALTYRTLPPILRRRSALAA